MRSLRLLAFVAPVFFLPLACEDSSGSSSGATFNPEAGSFEAGPSAEAGTPPVPEAGPDSAPPAPLGVTVTVTDDALPKSAVRVLLHDAAGLVIGEKATDAAGKATLPTAPSMVTVLISHGSGGGSSVSPVTFAGVADGDKLVVAAVGNVSVEPSVVGQYSVSFTNGGVIANANSFSVVAGAGCSGFGSDVAAPVVVSLFPSCLAAKNAVLTTATNGGGLLGFGFAKDIGKPAVAGNIDVGPLAFAAPGTTKLSAVNVPVTLNTFGGVDAIANGVLFQMSYGTGSLEDGGFTYQTPAGFADGYQSHLTVDQYNASSTSSRMFVRREAVPASNVLTDIDFTSALPAITDAPLTKPTPARPEVAFTTSGSLGTADGGIATLHWGNDVAGTTGSWTIVFPPSTASIKVPALPADATTFVPGSNVTIDEVIFIEATQVPGYKELRLLPVKPNFGIDVLDTTRPLPLPGTVRLTRWTPGVPG